MKFAGVCPFLTCLQTGPHIHPDCEVCGAVGFGNLFCSTCRAAWPRTPFTKLLDDALGPGIKEWPLGHREMKP
jgi:hypothetical protein